MPAWISTCTHVVEHFASCARTAKWRALLPTWSLISRSAPAATRSESFWKQENKYDHSAWIAYQVLILYPWIFMHLYFCKSLSVIFDYTFSRSMYSLVHSCPSFSVVWIKPHAKSKLWGVVGSERGKSQKQRWRRHHLWPWLNRNVFLCEISTALGVEMFSSNVLDMCTWSKYTVDWRRTMVAWTIPSHRQVEWLEEVPWIFISSKLEITPFPWEEFRITCAF